MRDRTGISGYGKWRNVAHGEVELSAWHLIDREETKAHGCGDWDIAWRAKRVGFGGSLAFPASIDTAPHRAFVAGVMPGYVYADWLEENVPEVPAEVLALLRASAEEG